MAEKPLKAHIVQIAIYLTQTWNAKKKNLSYLFSYSDVDFSVSPHTKFINRKSWFLNPGLFVWMKPSSF